VILTLSPEKIKFIELLATGFFQTIDLKEYKCE